MAILGPARSGAPALFKPRPCVRAEPSANAVCGVRASRTLRTNRFSKIDSSTMKRKVSSRFVRIGAAVVVAVAFIPMPQVVAPAWTVTTLNSARKPLQGVIVRENWQQYSLETSSHEEDRLTDSTGEVHFPRRTRWSTFAGRFAGCVHQFAQTGVHTSCGVDAHLVAFGRGIDTLDWKDPGEEDGSIQPWQHSVLVLNH